MIKKIFNLFSASDLILAVVFMLIICIMILPVESWMLDQLMVINMGSAVMILLVAMFLQKPLDFAAFPSILLVLTLFRLSLNVASTKLILSLGADFDGQVVVAFADFVTRGNFVVGIVSFIIITLVQFLFVNK